MLHSGRLPGRLPNKSERVAATRASLLARVRIGEGGLQALLLPHMHFSSSMEKLFTEQELRAMGRPCGFPIPFYDERGRVFKVIVQQSGGNYEFRGAAADGWARMVFVNDLRVNTVISIWVFREPMQLGSTVELPRLLFVVEEGANRKSYFAKIVKEYVCTERKYLHTFIVTWDL